MAKIQTRRTISLSRSVYDAARREAARRGLSASHFVDQCLRAQIREPLPETTHVPHAEAQRSAALMMRARGFAPQVDSHAKSPNCGARGE